MKNKLLLSSLIVALGLTSCVDNQYTVSEGLDSKFGINGSLALPIAYTTVKLIDGLEEIAGDIKVITEGEECYLQVETAQVLTGDFLQKIENAPTQEFNLPVPFTVAGHSLEVEHNLEFVFTDINTEGAGQSLDSLLYPEGQSLNLAFSSDISFEQGSKLTLFFNHGQVDLADDLYPGDSVVFDNISGELSDFKVDMRGAMVRFPNRSNQLDIRVRAELIFAETSLQPSSLNCYVNFSMVEPKITFGTVYEDIDIFTQDFTVNLPYSEQAQYNFPFSHPEMLVQFDNSIGVKAEYTIDYMRVTDGSGGYVYADFGGSQSTSLPIANPDIADLQSLTHPEILALPAADISDTSSVTFSRDFGSLDKLFTANPRSLEYRLSVVAPGSTEGNGVFYMSDSEMDVNVVSKLPLRFAGDKEGGEEKNFYVTVLDTIDLDMSSLSEFFTSGENGEFKLILSHQNHLPVDARFSLAFLDENRNPIIPSASGATFTIKAAPVNEAGEVIADSPASVNTVTIKGADCDVLLEQCKHIEFVYTALSEDFNNVYLHTNDWLYLHIGAGATGSFQF